MMFAIAHAFEPFSFLNSPPVPPGPPTITKNF
jgi:hypothetical protein